MHPLSQTSFTKYVILYILGTNPGNRPSYSLFPSSDQKVEVTVIFLFQPLSESTDCQGCDAKLSSNLSKRDTSFDFKVRQRPIDSINSIEFLFAAKMTFRLKKFYHVSSR
jgi:hypothetical protein